jgi:superfamily II RNA helicase
VLLLLPRRIGLIFLSATSPNKEEFAEWVGRVKRKRVHVLSTSKRPVPLTHYLFTCNTADMSLLMDGAAIDVADSEGWKGGNYKLLSEKLAVMRDRNKRKGGGGGGGAHPNAASHGGGYGHSSGGGGGGAAGKMGGGATRQEKQTWVQLVTLLQEKTLLPAIIFCFSKKKCEEVAFTGMASVLLTTARERGVITAFFDSALHRLSPIDRVLPQITRLKSLLVRGIGVHHSGLLPMMKECVELLFARGLIKLLVVTETFAMGISMPTRAVIFNGIRKHDGERWRELTAGEYTQMAGRSGRRGLDTRGVVIIMAWGDYLSEQSVLRDMMMGKPTSLRSQFRLTYNMILNVMRTDLPVTSMMARSYAEFGSQRALGGRDVAALLTEASSYLKGLEALALQEVCIRRDPGADEEGRALLALQQAGAAAKDGAKAAAGLNVAWAFGESGKHAIRDVEDAATGAAGAGKGGSGGSPAANAMSLAAAFGGVYNTPAADAYLGTLDSMRRRHLSVLRDVLSRGAQQPYAPKLLQALLPVGRIVVLDKLAAPVPDPAALVPRLQPAAAAAAAQGVAGPGASSAAAAQAAPAVTGSVMLWGIPAVVLWADPPQPAAAAAAVYTSLTSGSAGGSAKDGGSGGTTASAAAAASNELMLTVLAIAPAGYVHASEAPQAFPAPAPAFDAAFGGGVSGGASGGSDGSAGGGLRPMRRKDDDDLDSLMMGSRGARGAKGGSGGKGGAAAGRGGAGASGGGGSGSGGSFVGGLSSSVPSMPGLTPVDRAAYLHLYHPVNVSGGPVDARASDISDLRTLIVTQVPLSQLCYASELTVNMGNLGAGGERIPSLVTRPALQGRTASLQALERLAQGAWEALFMASGTDAADKSVITEFLGAYLRGSTSAATAAAASPAEAASVGDDVAAAPTADAASEDSSAESGGGPGTEIADSAPVTSALKPAAATAPARAAAAASGAATSTLAPPPQPLQLALHLEFGHAYGLPVLSPFSAIRLPDAPVELVEMQSTVEALAAKLGSIKCTGCERLKRQLRATRAVRRFRALLTHVRRKFSVQALALYPEMRSRFKVLRKLGYTRRAKANLSSAATAGGGRGRGKAVAVDGGTSSGPSGAAARAGGDEEDDEEDGGNASAEGSAALALLGDASSRLNADVVALKGRIAAEVNTTDELLFTEMVFEGVLGPLSPAEAAALLSVLVFQDKGAQMNTPFPAVSDDAVAIGLQAAPLPPAPVDGAPPLGGIPGLAPADGGAAGVGTGAGAGAPRFRRGGEDADDEDEGGAGSGDGGNDAAVFGGAGAGVESEAASLLADGTSVGAGAGTDAEAEAAVEMPSTPGAVVTVRAIPTVLAKAYYRLQEIALALARVQEACGIELIPTEYARERLNHGLLLATYAWACGMPFASICDLTDVAEGVIVRTITRLEETCRECRNAARVLGDPLLFRKMEAASACIKRDIVFANSLYLE